MSFQRPYCLETFANVYVLGPHKRQCKRRFYTGLSLSDFSDEDSTGASAEDSSRTFLHSDSQTDTQTTLWNLAQREKHGVPSYLPFPPVGRNLFYLKYTADYVCLQKAWDEHTTAIATLFDHSFWQTFDIVREQPGVGPNNNNNNNMSA